MEWKHPSIIALKGFPFTGKTSLSVELSFHLRMCLLLSIEDVLDPITPAAYSSTSTSTSRPPPAEAEKLVAQAFEVVCVQAEKQLSIGQSVIIDSLPLSRAHLHRLSGLSKSSKIVILDCQIHRSYAWEMRFKKKYPDHIAATAPWYKPRSWDEVRKAVSDYDKRLDEPVPGVSRLYLNVDDNVGGRHVIEAIQTLVFCQDDRHVDYQTWRNYNLAIDNNNEYKPDNSSDHDHTHCGHDHCPAPKELFSRRWVSHTTRSCTDGHTISVFIAEGIVGHEADCLVCDNPVTGPAYACSSCQAALHKSCAELELHSSTVYTPLEFPAFIKKHEDFAGAKDVDVYSFPENFPCLHCSESGKEFSDECSGCIFRSLLKSRLVPTIIEHHGHPHKLRLWAMIIKGAAAYTCGACGEKGLHVAYGCDGCDTNYHVDCALLPYPIKDHKHGGHTHTLELVFQREDKDFDDFPCSHCLENMTPEDWYYYCSLCYQTYHLKCAFHHDDDN